MAVDSLIIGSLWLGNMDVPAPQCTPHSRPPSLCAHRSCGCDGDMQIFPEDGGFVGPLHSEKSHKTCMLLPLSPLP